MYKLEKHSAPLYDQTKSEWMRQAKSHGRALGELLARDVGNSFAGITANLDQPNNHSYFLVDGNGKSFAILEIIFARPHKTGWLKLLDIKLCPSLIQDADTSIDTEKLKEAVEVVAFAITRSIGLIGKKEFKKAGLLKIYGRTELMSEIFSGMLVAGNLEKALKPLSLSPKIEGRWLVIKKI
ncbi:MAG: hypothetical protein ABFS18_07975 [Thermodesulfobacteriota bacterium]